LLVVKKEQFVKLAVIGMGKRMGYLIQDVFRKADPELEVVGAIDPNETAVRSKLSPEEQEKIVFCRSVPELLKRTRPDAVAIGTRCDLHARYAGEVLAAHLPLFLEKPVATSLKQAEALEKAYKKSRSRVVVSFPLRVSPLCRRAKQLLEEKAIGSCEHLLGVNYVPYGNVYFDSWYRDYHITQGLFLQKATHDFDYLSYLAGAPIVRVAAMLSRDRVYRDSSRRKNAADHSAIFLDGLGKPETGMNEDSSSALLEFANGAQGVYTQVFYSKREAAVRGATLSGRLGTITFDWYESRLKFIRHTEPVTDVSTVDSSVSHFGGDEVLGRNFLEVVKSGANSIAPMEAGLQSVYACLAARTSALKGKFMAVRQLGEGESEGKISVDLKIHARMLPEDLASLFAGVPELSPPGREEILSRIGTDYLLVVAERQGEILGFKLGYPLSSDCFYSWLGGVTVSARRSGIAKRLLRHQEILLRQRGFRRVRVKSMNRYPAMMCFLIGEGYQITGLEGGEPDRLKILFEKKLP